MLVYAVCISVNVILYLFKVRKYINLKQTIYFFNNILLILILNHLLLYMKYFSDWW